MPPRRRVRGPLGGAPVIRAAARPVVRVGAAGMGRFLGRLAGRGLAAGGGPIGVAATVGAAVADAVYQYAVDGGGPIGAVRDLVGGNQPQRLIPDYFPRNDEVMDIRGRDLGDPDPLARAEPNVAEYPSEPRSKRRKSARVSAFIHDNTQAKYIYDPTLPSTRFSRTKKGRYYSTRLGRSSFLSQRYF